MSSKQGSRLQQVCYREHGSLVSLATCKVSLIQSVLNVYGILVELKLSVCIKTEILHALEVLGELEAKVVFFFNCCTGLSRKVYLLKYSLNLVISLKNP